MDLLFELIGSPRGDRVREFYALAGTGTRDFRQLFVRILDLGRVVHRSATSVHRQRHFSTGFSTGRPSRLWRTVWRETARDTQVDRSRGPQRRPLLEVGPTRLGSVRVRQGT